MSLAPTPEMYETVIRNAAAAWPAAGRMERAALLEIMTKALDALGAAQQATLDAFPGIRRRSRTGFVPPMILSYASDPARKARHVALARDHRDAGRLVAGRYEGTRACSVGCLYGLRQNDHAGLANAASLPLWLVRVQDLLFERLPESDRAAWHVDLAEAIPVGVDLSGARDRWLLWLLADSSHGALRHARGNGIAAVETVIALLRRRIAGDAPQREEWAAARAAAAAAVAAVAVARATEWAAWATEEAAWAAEEAAWAAAADWRAVRTAHVRASRDELLRLLRAAA